MNFINKYNKILENAIENKKRSEMIKIENESRKGLVSYTEYREDILKEKEVDVLVKRSYYEVLEMADKIRNFSTISFEDIYDLLLPLLYAKTGVEYEFVNEFYATQQWVYIKRKDYEVNCKQDIIKGMEKDVVVLKSYAPIYRHVDEIAFFDRNLDTNNIMFLEDNNYEVNNVALNVLKDFMFAFVDYQVRENLYDKELSLLQFYSMYEDDYEYCDEEYDDYHGRDKRKKANKRKMDRSFKTKGLDLRLRKELKERKIVLDF